MIVYEDALIRVEQPDKGATQGTIVIEPQRSCQHLSDLDDAERAQFVTAANYAATVLFETLKAQGTNIIMNEEPLRCVVLARSESDKWSHQWQPVQVEQHDMSDTAEKINFAVPLKTQAQEPKESQPQTAHAESSSKPKDSHAKSEEQSEAELERKENYLIRQLYRVP